MRHLKIIIASAALLLGSIALHAQNVSDLIISEVMVANDSCVVDDYGRHSSWVELYNTSTGTVNFGGCFLSDDPANLTKSQIIKGDLRTKLGSRQVTLLYATGDSSEGTFYLSFTLKPGSTLYFTSNDGKTVIDSLQIPASIPQGMSISKFADDNKSMKWDRVEPAKPSPLSINGKHDQKSRAELIAETDPHGITLTIVSVSVVFCALIILFIIYSLLGGIFTGRFKRKKKAPKASAKGGNEAEIAAAIAMALRAECSGETEAAIAMAMHLYLSECAHDAEPYVITITQQTGAWNDKTRNFRRIPR